MTIRIECESCYKILKLRDSAAGKKIRCPGCQTVVKVPESRDRDDEDFLDDLDSLDEFPSDEPEYAPPARRRTSSQKKSRKKKRKAFSDYGNPVTSELAFRVIGGAFLLEFMVYVFRFWI